MNDYAANAKDDNGERVTLLSGESDFAEVGMTATGTTAPDAKTVWTEKDGKMVWRNSDGVVFARDVTVDGYLITVTDTIENKTVISKQITSNTSTENEKIISEKKV